MCRRPALPPTRRDRNRAPHDGARERQPTQPSALTPKGAHCRGPLGGDGAPTPSLEYFRPGARRSGHARRLQTQSVPATKAIAGCDRVSPDGCCSPAQASGSCRQAEQTQHTRKKRPLTKLGTLDRDSVGVAHEMLAVEAEPCVRLALLRADHPDNRGLVGTTHGRSRRSAHS